MISAKLHPALASLFGVAAVIATSGAWAAALVFVGAITGFQPSMDDALRIAKAPWYQVVSVLVTYAVCATGGYAAAWLARNRPQLAALGTGLIMATIYGWQVQYVMDYFPFLTLLLCALAPPFACLHGVRIWRLRRPPAA